MLVPHLTTHLSHKKMAPNDKPADPRQQPDPSDLKKRKKHRGKLAKSFTDQLASLENALPNFDEVPDPFSEATDEVGEL